jgi:predicted transcriptional regulator
MNTHQGIIRIPLDKGNFATISNNILHNVKLSSDAVRLLMLLINKSNDWDINLEFYSKKFDWTKKRQAKAVANLIDNGYIKRKKYTNGQGKGFTYLYTVSEYGNLVPKEDVSSLDTLNELPAIQPVIEEVNQPIPVIEELTHEQLKLISTLFQDLTDKKTHKHINAFSIEYGSYINDNKLNKNNFNIEKIKKHAIDYLNKKLEKEEKDQKILIKKLVENRKEGTKAEKIIITEKMLKWFDEEYSTTGNMPTEDQIKIKLPTTVYSNITIKLSTANQN